MRKVDVIIPTYKPDNSFLQLIERLQEQTISVNRIIIMNTEQKYFDALTYGTSFFERNQNVVVKHLSKREFDHGGTRDKALGYSDADFFLMMTQDAIPTDERLVESLLSAVQQDMVAVAYARQLPKEDSKIIEHYTRQFNYPEESRIKTKKDLDELGIKTFFCSNVCAMYDRKIYDALGGFVHHTIFNEDMIYAAKAIENGYGVAYESDAGVYHSHDYSNKEQFQRNFDLGVSQAQHPEVFAKYPSESEGISYVRKIVSQLKNSGNSKCIFHFIVQSGCKFLGYKFGKGYRKLTRKMILTMSSNKMYWK